MRSQLVEVPAAVVWPSSSTSSCSTFAVPLDRASVAARVSSSPAMAAEQQGMSTGPSKGCGSFHCFFKLSILGPNVLLRHVDIRLDASSFQQLLRRGVPGSARNPHEEVVADRFRITADHLAGRSCTD